MVDRVAVLHITFVLRLRKLYPIDSEGTSDNKASLENIEDLRRLPSKLLSAIDFWGFLWRFWRKSHVIDNGSAAR